MRLIELKLRNFKGVRDFTFRPEGGDASVFGANFSGKSTVCNAWHWLLTGKDSAGKQATGRSSFEIKRLENGTPEHGAENEVEGIIQLDNGAEHTIKKVFREVWEKHRGGEKTLKGNTVDHFLDGIPVKEKEYLDFLNSIADQEVLQILTNPSYFPSMMPWERRRQILVGLCPEITDDDVYASNPKLEDLRDILAGPPVRTVENHLKVCKARKTELNKAIDDIPVRVSEQKRNCIDAGIQEGPVRAKIAELQKDKSAEETVLATLQNGGAIAEKRRELAEVETKLITLQNAESRALNDALEKKRTDLNKLKFGLGALEADARSISARITENSITIGQHTAKMDGLRADWNAWNTKQFQMDGHCTCPDCGNEHEIATDKIDTAKATFNINRAEGLKGMNAEGMKLKELVEKLEAENAKLAEAGEVKRQAAEKLIGEIKALEAEINKPAETESYYDNLDFVNAKRNPEQYALKEKIASVRDAIASLSENIGPAVAETQSKITVLDAQIQAHNTTLAQIDTNKKALARIKELNQEHRNFAAELERVQREIFLCEEFNKAQARLITGNVESLFEFAKFKLFDEAINGSLIPCCEVTTPNGVPFTQDSSGSEKVHAGLDIIKTLSKHYGLTLPIFCDDAERTTDFPKMDSQMIRLYVSREDSTLRIEMENVHERAA